MYSPVIFRRIIILLIGICFSQPFKLQAQDAASLSKGFTGISRTDATGIWYNPASLAQYQQTSLHVDALNLFSIASLNQFSTGAAIDLKKIGTAGIHVQQFGFDSFRDQKATLSYSRKILKKLNIGIQGIYLNRSIENYGSKQLFSAALGFISKLTSKVQMGGLLLHPFPQEWSSNEKLLPTMVLGVHYKPSESVTVDFDIEKEFETKVNAKIGISYHPIRILDLNLGINTNPSLVTFGFGVQLKEFGKINLGMSYHQILGFSSGIGFSYIINRKE